MNTNKKFLVAVMAIGLVGVLLYVNGCKESGKAKAATVELCTECGQIKGGDVCCKPDQAKCAGCGLAKGSPGCCNIPKGATSASLCAKCGQLTGSDECCKPDQPTCPTCGLVKGSPGCCKIPKAKI